MDTESGLPTGSGGLFGSGVMSESVAFLAGGEAAAPVETQNTEAAPVEDAPAGEAPVETAAESERETPPVNDAVGEVLPKRGGPSPVLREYLKSQEERVRRAEAAVEAQRQENAKLLELAQSLMAGKAPAAAEETPEEEPLDPLERDLKAMRAKVEAMERANQEREERIARVRMERAYEAAKNEIVSEVDAVVKEFPHLAEFRNEVYANIAHNSEAARIPGSGVKELPVAEIARQFARRLGLVKGAEKPPVATPASAQVKPSTPASKAAVPRHPAASASVPTVPKDVTKMSFQDLSTAWANGQ